MDDAGPPKSGRFTDSIKTTIGVLVALVVVLIAAGFGVAAVRDAKDTVHRAKESVAGATTTTAPAADLTPEQSKVVDEIKAQVSSIRGLPWKGTLPIKVVTKEELAKRVRDLNAQDEAKHHDELAADESLLKLLQLI